MTNQERARKIISEYTSNHSDAKGPAEMFDFLEGLITAALDAAEVRGIAKHVIR